MEPLIIFTHIPKTAGSTITSVIEAVYRPREIAKIYSDSDAARFMETLPPEVRFLTGHFPYGLHRHTPRPCRYFTVLRDPAERVVSLYYYLRRATDHASHARIASGQETFVDVVNSQPDEQTRYLAGLAQGDSRPAAEKLALAKEHLASAYGVGGLAERFDESLLLLEAAFGWRVRSYRRQNATKRRPPREALPEEVRAALERNNKMDQELYDFACGRFTEAVAAQGEGFAERLRGLRERTERMGRVYAITEVVHGWVQRVRGR